MKIIFSDLDGSLLDHNTYSFDAAKEALEKVKKLKIPIILCSSKTGSELKKLRSMLSGVDPFIVENGGAIYFPKGYRSFDYAYAAEDDFFNIIELGDDRQHLRKIFLSVKEKLKLQLRSFSDMSLSEVVELTSLAEKDAKMAMDRRYSEPFIIAEEELGREVEIVSEIEKMGGRVLKGGRFYHLMGKRDKGDAVKIIHALFTENSGEDIYSIGLGDSENDLSMLKAVDKAVIIRRWDGSWLDSPGSEAFTRTEKIGPAGWNEAVLEFIGR